jgi:hypothetical protein
MRKKKRIVGVAIVVALVAAGVAYAAASPSAKLEKQDRLYGGGQFGPGCFIDSTICFPNARNFSVDAHAEGDGSEAVGNSNYAAPGGAGYTRTVTCLGVDGNKAVVGGIILSSGDPSQIGWGYVQYFVDRGGPGAGPRDLASGSYLLPLGAPEWPAGFPTVCPPTTGTPDLAAIYQEVHSGDLVVQDAAAD